MSSSAPEMRVLTTTSDCPFEEITGVETLDEQLCA
jgi:hypothetical protein